MLHQNDWLPLQHLHLQGFSLCSFSTFSVIRNFRMLRRKYPFYDTVLWWTHQFINACEAAGVRDLSSWLLHWFDLSLLFGTSLYCMINHDAKQFQDFCACQNRYTNPHPHVASDIWDEIYQLKRSKSLSYVVEICEFIKELHAEIGFVAKTRCITLTANETSKNSLELRS